VFRVLMLAGVGLAAPSLAVSAPLRLHGRAVDPAHQPLEGVTVSVEGSAAVAESAPDGTFTLELETSVERVSLHFEHAGYHPLEHEVAPDEVGREIEVVLVPLTRLEETVTVTASRLDRPLRDSPAAISTVEPEALEGMPRGIGADEALSGVPGVKIDNQADGERVHLSIRGQGILTERGIRGIQVQLDGVPLNDPSGFVPDLYDVDWVAVDRVEVVRGPVGFLYGGGSSGGILDIVTRGGEGRPFSGRVWATAGSNGFFKLYGDAGGTRQSLDYHLALSGHRGDGYRDHTAFWAENLRGKLAWQVTPRFRLGLLLYGTGFFNENAEGLNLGWLAEDRRQANPDALTFDEYQKTRRESAAVTGRAELAENQVLSFAAYFRHTGFTESVPSSVQHRDLDSPGLGAQYLIRSDLGRFHNTLSLGGDVDRQKIDEYRRPNLGGAVEGPGRLSDQSAWQTRLGGFVQDRLELSSHWALLMGLRYDRIDNRLDDRLKADGLDLSGEARFEKATGRIGVTFSVSPHLDLFASWGQGFLPPATEELYANPAALGGYNTGLVPAASWGEELGARGGLGSHLSFAVAGFHLDTQDDFERYRITERPLETFYRNASDSRRYGLEAELRWQPVDSFTLRGAYTFNDFTYRRYDSFTYPGDLAGNGLPNSPRHQAYLTAEYRWRGFLLDVDDLTLSRAYVDATNVASIDGYSLLGARIGYRLRLGGREAELFASGRNLTGTEYIAFTEPDPDGNSYQPGPEAEYFGGVQLRF
jgi:iron complex outermembrane receptor protein